MAAPRIVSADNVGDGQSLTVMLTVAPTGPLTFYVGRFPGSLGDVVTIVTGSGAGPYVVKCPEFAAISTVLRIFQWVYAHDNGGVDLTQRKGDWLCQGDNRSLALQTEEAVHDALSDQLPAIDRALQHELGAVPGQRWPNTDHPVRVAKCLRGMPQFDGESMLPAINIMVHDWDEDLNLDMTQYTDGMPLRGTIWCHWFHQNDTPGHDVCRALAAGVFSTLNQRHYLEFDLPCGLRVIAAHVTKAQVTESYQADIDCQYARAVLSWSGEISVGMAG